jgi:hypothetical protein
MPVPLSSTRGLRLSFAVAPALAAAAALAQPDAGGPPANALVPDAARIASAVADHVFQWDTRDSGRSAPGTTARMRFTGAGLVTSDMSTGVFYSGHWEAKGSSLCFQWSNLDASESGCNAVRIDGDVLWLQHRGGTWSAMKLIRPADPVTRAG